VRLAGRLFVGSSLLLAATAIGLVLAAGQVLRREVDREVASGLEREARLVAALLPADSLTWPEAARRLGALIGHRVTLIDPSGRVRGDTEFDRASLAQLENHATRPEVVQAIAEGTGIGHDVRLSVSTNQRRLYVAIRGGPPGLAVVRLSTTLGAIEDSVGTMQRGVALAGLVALAVAALLAWFLSRSLAQPLAQLGDAAHAIAAGEEPVLPSSPIPEIARHTLALRAMHEQLGTRFSELRREREETQTLIEAMADGVVAADGAGEIVALNAAARRLLGYRLPDRPPPLGQLFHDKRARDFVRAALEGQEVEQRELDLDGRTLLVTSRPLPKGGALLVFRDVTDFRRLELVRRDFVANVSHELKTPLTSIAGYAETLAAEAGGDTQSRRFAETILSNARRMQRLVDDLLDLSRIESGSWHPTPRPVDVVAMAHEAWAPFADRARGAGVLFSVDAAAPSVAADPDALRQILTNLLDNSLRHTHEHGAITVRTAPAPGGTTVEVTDTGTGIPSEHLPRIFERFYRADASRSREQGGTGLGLAIVKHLVEAHGGRAEAISNFGSGTTIRLFFPTAEA